MFSGSRTDEAFPERNPSTTAARPCVLFVALDAVTEMRTSRLSASSRTFRASFASLRLMPVVSARLRITLGSVLIRFA
jgi:hypothetical protein